MGGILVLFTLIFSTLFASSFVEATCGYESCPKTKDGLINIHLIPHSHDDVGWLKTVDQYFYGDRNNIQMGGVQYIIDSVVDQLQKSPDRRFIYVESAFFYRWWKNRNSQEQQVVRELVEQGRLEFIGGGWSMQDEAGPHYSAIVDQMSLGLRFLNDTFGQCSRPRVAWQIDPFGHSRESSSLFAQMGFDGLFFGRLDYQDKRARMKEKKMQMIWNTSPANLGKDAWLFTGVLFNSYDPPRGFCFDVICSDGAINYDPQLLGYNLDEKVRNFTITAEAWAEGYRTNHVIMTMGSDFQYMAAQTWFNNLDILIKNVNALQANGSKINLLYSTPSCYLQEVHKAGLNWPVKDDDFFPYASDEHAFWTGYFTSRPTLKGMISHGDSFLRTCKQLSAFRPDLRSAVGVLERAMGVSQHHDAVAGTAKQHVTDDYALRISLGMKACESVIGEAFGKPLTLNGGDFVFCHLLNISQCEISEQADTMTLFVYNSLARDVTPNLRIPVITPLWKVTGPDGEEFQVQVVPIPIPLRAIPGRESKAKYEIVFNGGTISGLSIKNYWLTRVKSDNSEIKAWRTDKSNLSNDFEIRNTKNVSCIFDGQTGLLKSLSRGGDTIKLEQNFYYYKGMKGYNFVATDRASGAYIFRPNGTLPIKMGQKAKYSVYTGTNVVEVHQVFSPWVSQVIRLYENADFLEFEWLVGPIPIEDGFGKEVITKYTSDIPSGKVFFTDANGREILKRKRNFRETWEYKVNEPISGNYYPVNTRMMLSVSEDLSKDPLTLVVLNDRTQGGSSMKDGELELMVHRRLLMDDAFGVGEPLNETQFGKGLVVRGKHQVFLAGGKTGVPLSIHRSLAQELYADLHPAFLKGHLHPKKIRETSRNDIDRREGMPLGSIERSELAKLLPKNVHLLSLEALDTPRTFLVRFEHFYESWDDTQNSKPAIIPIKHLRELLEYSWIKETSLGGNSWRDEEKRFDWKTQGSINPGMGRNPVLTENDDDIRLNPMEIRSFIFYR